MKKTSFHILRVGTAVTFLWIGVLIIKQPEAWSGYIQPWAAKLLTVPIKEVMLGTAVLDILIGFLLLTDTLVWLAALLGALHMVVVLTVSGITDITVRDIAIFAASAALFIDCLPENFLKTIPLKKSKKIINQ